jgi:predicted transposase/invertase (TIGR01784 family)
MEHYINPYTDFGFKKIFGEEGSKELLRDFLNSLLPAEHKIATLTFTNPTRLGANRVQKAVAFDIHCKNERDEPFIVEMQKSSQDHFIDRAYYSISELLRAQDPRPKGVSERDVYALVPVYFVGILDFVYDRKDSGARDTVLAAKSRFTHSEFERWFYVKDQNNEIGTDLFAAGFFQMPLFEKTAEQLKTPKDKWFYFLKNLPCFDHIPAILNEPVFQQAFKTASYVALTPDEQAEYNDHEKAWLDIVSAKNTAVNAAVEKTLKEAEKEKSKAIKKVAKETNRKNALAMKQKGYPVADIAEITGLPASEIETL